MKSFVSKFQDNHKLLVDDLLKFYNVSLDDLNSMLKRSYIAVAGGYARRLHMVQNGVQLAPEDISAYPTSDLDVFSISCYAENLDYEKEKKALEKETTPDDIFGIALSTSSKTVSRIEEDLNGCFTTYVNMVNGKDGIETTTTEVPFTNISQEWIDKGFSPKYAIETENFIIDTRTGALSIMELYNKAGSVEDCPKIQVINTSAKSLGTDTTTIIDKKLPCARTQKLLANFDLSASMYYISNISYDIDQCTVHYVGPNVDDPYHCYINDTYSRSVGMPLRVAKYSALGFLFNSEQLKEITSSDVTMEEKINEHLGGYDDVY